MNRRYDPELEEILHDPELMRLAGVLSSAHTPDPPLDEAFRSGLRRELMQKAWEPTERRGSFWRLLSSPPRLAWVGAAAMVALIALVVLQTQQPLGNGEVAINSPQSGGTAVPLQQPILVSFNQPMDHQSTEAALEIAPATAVEFRWVDDTQLYVQPKSGNLAPNTQYQVTIGPGARTKGGKALSTPRAITFVSAPVPTQPPPSSPTPGGTLLSGQHQVAAVQAGISLAPQWSPDGATLYFLTSAGVLRQVPAGGGQATILVAGGVSAFAVSTTGDRIAFIRSGHVQVLMLGIGQTIAVSGSTAATAVAWTRDRLYWAGADGIFAATGPAGAGGSKVTSNPDPAGTFVSIAPDGAHAILRNGAGALVLVDVSSGGTTPLGSAAAARFQGWSPDGTRVIHDGVISDMTGNLVGRLPQGDASWSAQGTILVGGDSSLVALKPDGSGQVQLASGNSFRLPAWAPDGSTFGFVRGNSLWVASVPSVSRPQSRPIDDATAVVNAFMQARLAGDLVKAMSYLDDNARAQYAAAGPVLIPVRDLGFKRYYILAAEVDATSPNTVRFVVRLAFAGRGGPIERNMSEETLILKRATVNDPFLIDKVIVSPVRQLGRGPVVVAVRITPTQVAVTFDSDLQPPTINGVVVQDSNGTPVNATVSYADRTITFSGLQLTAGASYRIVVLPTVLDIGNQKPAQEYDLDFVGPGVDTTSTSLSGAAGGDGNQQAIGG